jgi:hypothetical protein
LGKGGRCCREASKQDAKGNRGQFHSILLSRRSQFDETGHQFHEIPGSPIDFSPGLEKRQ